MKEFISTYLLYIKTFFKSRAEYRVGFFLGQFSNFYRFFIPYLTFIVLVNEFGTIGGWDFNDLSILFGISILTYSISGTFVWYTVYNMSKIVTDGGLDIYLVRPIGVLRQMIFQRFGDTFIGEIVVTLIFLSAALIAKADTFNVLKIIYFIFVIAGGCFAQCGAMIFLGALSFWILRSGELSNTLYYDIRSMTQYPLIVFPIWIQYLLTYIFPWAFINYYPALILTNKLQSTYDLVLGLLSPIIGIFIFCIGILTFNKGLKKYTSAGN